MASLNLLKELPETQTKVCGELGSPKSCAYLGSRARDARLGDVAFYPDPKNPDAAWSKDPTLVCCKADASLREQIGKRLADGKTKAKLDGCSGPPDYKPLAVR